MSISLTLLDRPSQPIIQPFLLHAQLDTQNQSYHCSILREDLRHPYISGNKWHKLIENVQYAQQLGLNSLGSFGGFFSNHLHALAYLGHCLEIPTIGVIRGQGCQTLTPTLIDAKTWGMQLIFSSKTEFSQIAFHQQLHKEYAETYWIPSGGYNVQGLRGCAAWAKEIIQTEHLFHYWLLPIGSGCTIFGLWLGLYQLWQQGVTHLPRLVGIKVLKGPDTFAKQIDELIQKEHIHPNYIKQYPLNILSGYDYGGFGKSPEVVLQCMGRYANQFQLDKIYTAKTMLALEKLTKEGYFTARARILLIHTGGLQGNRPTL
jgi:1-aminocyclopropane-1-carboxylate deaminase